MRRKEQLKNKLDATRFIHLAVSFMIAMFLFLFTTIPEKWWILLTVLVCSAGVEPGLIMKRSAQRIKGTIIALLIIVPLIYTLHINYRLVHISFIVSFIALNVTANAKRYDITVIFITLMVFLLLAQITSVNSQNGSFEMLINRSICTAIGIGIVYTSDYLLFQGDRYSYKLYLFHQIAMHDFLRQTVNDVMHTPEEAINTFLFIERLRDQVILQFSPIQISAENLMLEKNIDPKIKQNITAFQTTIWEMRRLLFALCFAKFILKSSSTTEKHVKHFNKLLEQTKNHFIFDN